MKRLTAAALAVAMAVAFGVITSPGPRTSAGVSTSPGRIQARKAGTTQQEYLPISGTRYLAIPGVRGTGSSGGGGR